MAAEALVQDRHNNDVLAQPDHGASTASGLSLLRFFSLQTLRLSPQFRFPSLYLQSGTWVFFIFANHADPSSKFPHFLKIFWFFLANPSFASCC